MNGLDYIGPHGGEVALAFGTGCAAGYAFCVRTVHKMLHTFAAKEHELCMDRIAKLEEEKDDMKARLHIIEERYVFGINRQMDQMRDSSVRVLGESKLGEGA